MFECRLITMCLCESGGNRALHEERYRSKTRLKVSTCFFNCLINVPVYCTNWSPTKIAYIQLSLKNPITPKSRYSRKPLVADGA